MPEQLREAGTILEAATPDAATTGQYRVLVISEGQGSSGVYPRKTLQEAAAKGLIGPGTPAYFDHPGATEAMDRPERSVRDIAGVYTSPATWSDEHNGLVSDLQVFAPHRPLVAEMAPHIGLSIRGSGLRESVDGKPTVTSLDHIESVDLVTKAGRGGKFLSLLESAHPTFDATDMAAAIGLPDTHGEPPAAQPSVATESATTTTVPAGPGRGSTAPKEGLVPELSEADVAQLRESAARAEAAEARLAESTARIAAMEARNAARPVVAAKVAESKTLGARTQARLVESVVAALPVVDGTVAEEALTQAVTAAVEAAEAEAAEYGRPAPVTEAWGAFTPAKPTEVAEADAVKAFDAELAGIFHRPTLKG